MGWNFFIYFFWVRFHQTFTDNQKAKGNINHKKHGLYDRQDPIILLPIYFSFNNKGLGP